MTSVKSVLGKRLDSFFLQINRGVTFCLHFYFVSLWVERLLQKAIRGSMSMLHFLCPVPRPPLTFTRVCHTVSSEGVRAISGPVPFAC